MRACTKLARWLEVSAACRLVYSMFQATPKNVMASQRVSA
jgi:hypothetical protein